MRTGFFKGCTTPHILSFVQFSITQFRNMFNDVKLWKRIIKIKHNNKIIYEILGKKKFYLKIYKCKMKRKYNKRNLIFQKFKIKKILIDFKTNI